MKLDIGYDRILHKIHTVYGKILIFFHRIEGRTIRLTSSEYLYYRIDMICIELLFTFIDMEL